MNLRPHVWLLGALVAWGAWQYGQDRPVATASGRLAPDDPIQIELKKPQTYAHGEYTLTALASYEITARVLESLGHRTEVAYGGLEALECCHKLQGTLKLVVLDMIMPGMDGGETFRRLREQQATLPVLFYSGYPGEIAARELEAVRCTVRIAPGQWQDIQEIDVSDLWTGHKNPPFSVLSLSHYTRWLPENIWVSYVYGIFTRAGGGGKAVRQLPATEVASLRESFDTSICLDRPGLLHSQSCEVQQRSGNYQSH